MTTLQTAITVAVFALVTWLTRVLPFWVFPPSKPTPRYVVYLGRVLPFAITGMLVVYCLKDVQPAAYPHGIPELLAVLVVAGLYLWRKNTLLAIGAGTVLYMVLMQLVFV